jgi:serine phosphatase RsbU (regulator of sigma subunit)
MKSLFVISLMIVLTLNGLTASDLDFTKKNTNPLKARADFIAFLTSQLNWPDKPLNNSFTLCIWNEDGLASELNHILPTFIGKSKLPVRIVPVHSFNELVPCQLLVGNISESPEMSRLLSVHRGKFILLVVENEREPCRFPISFILSDDRICFTLCPNRLQEAEVEASAIAWALGVDKDYWKAVFRKNEEDRKPVLSSSNTSQPDLFDLFKIYEDLLSQRDRKQKKLNETELELDAKSKILSSRNAIVFLKQDQIVLIQRKMKEEQVQVSSLREEIRVMDDRINTQKKILNGQENKLTEQGIVISRQGRSLRNTLNAFQEQHAIIAIVGFLSTGVLMLLGLVLWFNHERKKTNRLLTEQKATVEEQKLNITDSITYARRIQSAILPPLSDINSVFPSSFILYKPKDIVSGDFYWLAEKDNRIYFAAADCTGHGVPGGFMSMIASELLNEAILHQDDISFLLQEVNIHLKKALHQSAQNHSPSDGMDIAVVAFNPEKKLLQYAGAFRPLWILRRGASEVVEIKGTKSALGGYTTNEQFFPKHEFQLNKGDRIYLFSDGYADQFGPENKKLMTSKFRKILLTLQNCTMAEQAEYLDSFIESWKGGLEQTDDILVVGIQV